MKIQTVLPILLGLQLCALTTRAIAQEQPKEMVDPSRIVLVVNGEEIKGSEYYRRMEYLQGVGFRTGNSFSEYPPGFITIQQIINERLIFALAKDKGAYPSDAEVDGEIKIRLAENPKMLENWIAGGGNMDELKYQLRVQIAQFKISTFGITVTDTEVEDHYKSHPDLFTAPKSLKLRLIAVATADETKIVDNDLAGGKDFASEAKEKSVDISKSIGGEFGTIPEFKLEATAREALAATKIGQTTKWLTTAKDGGSGTYLKFLLEDIIPAKLHELDPTLRRVIRRQLMLDKGHVKNPDVAKELDQQRVKAKIDIKQAEFADAYQKFLGAYLKQKGIN